MRGGRWKNGGEEWRWGGEDGELSCGKGIGICRSREIEEGWEEKMTRRGGLSR